MQTTPIIFLFGACGLLAPACSGGTKVRYYVEPRPANGAKAACFSPPRAVQETYKYRVVLRSATSTDVVINEIMADNQTILADAQGGHDDWIELLNVCEKDLDLSGMYLTDKKNNPRKWAFPKGTAIAPGDYLIVWADEDGDAEPGLHANFKLSSDGEVITLIDTDEQGNALLDSVTFGKQRPDAALGRLPDGNGAFRKLQATPGKKNKKDK